MSNWEHNITGVEWANFSLWTREQIFAEVCKEHGVVFDQEQVEFAVMWEDPRTPDEPMKITVPSPQFWAMALHGGILPPVEVYWALAHDEAQPGFVRHTRGHLLHETPPMRAMTPEEAIEYIIMKDLPPAVWRDYKGNRTILRIVPRAAVPTNRALRNAWRITQEAPLEEEAA